MIPNRFKKVIFEEDGGLTMKEKNMKKSFATTIRAALAAVLCLGAGMAPAALNISEILLFTDNGATTIINRDNKLWFVVGFDDTSLVPDPVLGLTGTPAQKPTLEFFLGGSPRSATFHSLGTGALSSYMYFYYTPLPADYGQGITIDNHAILPTKRVAILKNGSTIVNTNAGGGSLPDNDQYTYADGNAFTRQVFAEDGSICRKVQTGLQQATRPAVLGVGIEDRVAHFHRAYTQAILTNAGNA